MTFRGRRRRTPLRPRFRKKMAKLAAVEKRGRMLKSKIWKRRRASMSIYPLHPKLHLPKKTS